jgi:hypothetical protein
MYRKLRNILIPTDLQFKLLDTLMLPILTYGSEIWGYENTKQLENFSQCGNNFNKYLSKLNSFLNMP